MNIARHPLYRRYTNMRLCCYSVNYPDYQRVGARGIGMAWSTGRQFIADIEAHLGPQPSPEHRLSRKDLNKDYMLSNLEWARPRHQASRWAKYRLRYKNKTWSIGEWSEITGISYTTLYWRYTKGWKTPEILGYKARP